MEVVTGALLISSVPFSFSGVGAGTTYDLLSLPNIRG